MDLQTGLGLSKFVLFAGAGCTCTLVLKNGKMADVLRELPGLVKRFRKSGNRLDEGSNAMSREMQQLTRELRQFASSPRQINVINRANRADFTTLIVPAVTLGALGYGYMRFKGMTFSDIMCITKRNMENAISNLSKHLDIVSEAISTAKKHLSQRLQMVDDKLDLQKDLLMGVHDNVGLALEDLANMGDDFDAMHAMFGGMGGKLDSIENKQNVANIGLKYLRDSMDGQNHKRHNILIHKKLRLLGMSNTWIVITNKETSSSEAIEESDKLELLDD